MREVLRLEPPLPVFAVKPYRDVIIGKNYKIGKDESCVILLQSAHRDINVYGADAEAFKPERMLDENFEQLPPGSFKPFGNGQRACIGRHFAFQEATLMLSMLLQNFNIVLDDPEYQLQYNATLTMKPKNFKIRAHLRTGLTPTALQHRLMGRPVDLSLNNMQQMSAGGNSGADGKPLTILYGSNSGTCESLAQLLAAHALSQGFSAQSVESLDSARGRLPFDHPIVIITTSYDGQPTENAKRFVSWLEEMAMMTDSLAQTRYAIFGLGNRDWVSTFHKIPKLIDNKLQKAGARRLVPLCLNDVGSCEIFSTFETWEDEILWPTLHKLHGTNSETLSSSNGFASDFDFFRSRAIALRHHVSAATVITTQVLTKATEPLKKHIEILLPKGMRYRTGDYLTILPVNPQQTILRVLRHFDIPNEFRIMIGSQQTTTVETSIALSDILESWVELSRCATKRGISALVAATQDVHTKKELQSLLSTAYHTKVVASNISILDLLERFPKVALPIESFLRLLPPMRLRC